MENELNLKEKRRVLCMKHDEVIKFERECKKEIEMQKDDKELREITQNWFAKVERYKYSYHFSWMGRPIIQYPQDIIAIQELIWKEKPDVIIETGIAHGGSLVFYASMLTLLNSDGFVIGVDIDVREHNRFEIEKHPMFERIRIIEGSSIDKKTIGKIENLLLLEKMQDKKIFVVLDSCHTCEHVLEELRLYSKFVKKNSYLLVLDTIINDMDKSLLADKPWKNGNNPKKAVKKFLLETDRFVIDEMIQSKILITVAPDGYLKCISD